MHTVVIIGGGLILLGVFILIGRLKGRGDRASMGRAALLFIPIWLICAAINMTIGVGEAGYTVAQELPFFALVFGIPGLAAFLAYRSYGGER